MHTCSFTDSASNPQTLQHEGTREAAIEHFHGKIGPCWPVVFDGVEGYFTALPVDIVRFVEGPVPTVAEQASSLLCDALTPSPR